jgi:RNA polymerase sigma factor (sigma-70 family)
LKDGQWQVFESLQRFFKDGQSRGFIKIPARVGKAVIITELAEALNLPCIVVTPRDGLRADLLEKFAQFAPTLKAVDLYDVDRHRAPFDAAVSTYQYLVINKDNADYARNWRTPLILLDEGHEMMGQERNKLLDSISQDSIVIALTATDRYSERRSLATKLGPQIHEMTIREAVHLRLIAPFVVITAETEVDLSEVQVVGGGEDARYSRADLARAVNLASLNESAVKLHLERFKDKYEIDFCCGVQHAIDLAAAYRAAGVPAESITHKDSKEVRREKKAALREGRIRVLTNDSLLKIGETFENVSVVQNLAPTLSLVDCEQRAFRAMTLDRRDPEKVAVVVEYLHRDQAMRRKQVTLLDIVNCAYIDNEPQGRASSYGGFFAAKDLKVEGLIVSANAEKVMEVHNKRKAASQLADGHPVDEPAKELRDLIVASWDLLLRLPAAAQRALEIAEGRLAKVAPTTEVDEKGQVRRVHHMRTKRELRLREYAVRALRRTVAKNGSDFERFSSEAGDSGRFVLFSQQTAEIFKHVERKIGRGMLSASDFQELRAQVYSADVELRGILSTLSAITHPRGFSADACLRHCSRRDARHIELNDHLRGISPRERDQLVNKVTNSFAVLRAWEDRNQIRWDAFRSLTRELSELDQEIALLSRDKLIELSVDFMRGFAKEFKGRGLTYSDLVGIGYVTVTEAVPRYASRISYAYSTFLAEELRRDFEAAIKDEQLHRNRIKRFVDLAEVKSDPGEEFITDDEGCLTIVDDEESGGPFGIEDREARFFDDGQSSLVHRALSELPEDLAQVIRFRYCMPSRNSLLPFSQLAEILRCPVGTAKSTWTRILQRLARFGETLPASAKF